MNAVELLQARNASLEQLVELQRQQIESLSKRVVSLFNELATQRKAAQYQHRYEHDYLPYDDDDRR